ncbi:MAG: 1-phosphofructokinase family hexose kinase [Thermotogae bacterium]|nr:1-phosphofructokinase family hexose kinase [Thermotogota bacterium]HOO74318.1 PfkB family carbohydrate kinase [Tepiditoga sp.]
MNYDILCVTLNPSLDREIVIEKFDTGELYRINNPSNSVMEPGGKGINVALMLSTLGVKSITMGFLGGFIGKVIQSKLASIHEITTNFVYTNEETRENIEIIDTKQNKITEINSMGPFVSEDDYSHFIKRYQSTMSLTDHVVISGSIPPGVPIHAYSDFFRQALDKNKFTYMEAIGPHFDEAIKNSCPMVVRPDLRKSRRVLGTNIETLDDYIYVSRKIIEHGAKLVVMSYNIVADIVTTAEGSWMFTATNEIDRSHLFGSGDAYMAGIVYYMQKNSPDFFEAAKFGMATAISSTRYIGKILGDEEEINQDTEKFKIEKIG